MPRKKPPARPTARPFDVMAFLDAPDIVRTIAEFPPLSVIFNQGDACSSVMYIQHGTVKLSVVSPGGKEAIVAMLSRGDFLGEGALAAQHVRLSTATAISTTTVLVIPTKQMLQLLQHDRAFAHCFIEYMLFRHIRIEEDLVDQLFNSSEKRLARTLLLLARYGKDDRPHGVMPVLSQETLAEIVGTTRSRVNFFMNKFKKMGFIEYDGTHKLKVHASLLSVVLHFERPSQGRKPAVSF